MEAKCLHDFNATADDELSFCRGTVIKVIDKDEDENWFRAELNGREGYVPSNYIEMLPHPWYQQKIRRSQAEDMLLAQEDLPDGNRRYKYEDGSFIVRDSETSQGDFSLSVKFQNQVQHFRVLRDGAGKYFLWEVKFNSLNELVNHHKTSSISRSQQIFLRDMMETVIYVQAVYDFEPEDANELGFSKGEIIRVTNHSDTNWWEGELGSRRGLFPRSYVRIYNP